MKKILRGFAVATLIAAITAAAEIGRTAVPGTAFQTQYRAGREAFEQARYGEAYAHFLAAYRENPADPGINFHLGRAAFEVGNYEAAVLAFERVILATAEPQRARLELARCYYRLGLLSMARLHFQTVLDTGPPEPVRKNIEAFLARIDATQKRHFFSGIFTIGFHYDTNVLASPENTIIQTPALIIPFVEVDDEKADFFGSLTLALEHRYRPAGQKRGWKTNAVTYNTFYADTYDNGEPDVNFLSLASGPSWETERHIVDLQGVYEYLDKGYDAYLRNYGLQLNTVTMLKREFFVAAGMRLMDKEYRQAPKRESINTRLTLGPTYTSGVHRVTGRLGFERENANVDTEAYNEFFCSLRYDRRLPSQFVFLSEYRFQYRDYDERNVIFAKHRDDQIHNLTVGVNRFLSKHTLVELSYTYTTTSSSIELFEYNRHLTSLSISSTF